MTTVNANEVALGIESFGDDDAPLVLLAGGTTMLSWPDALCERLAAGGRRVVRYDLRDSGESTTAHPDAPTYTLRDLAADAAALADALGGGPAHLAGIGVGGMVAQVAALDHPSAFSALTLADTRAVAPGKPDADLPDHDQATMKRLFAHPMPDWTDREAVANFAAARAEILGDDPSAARATAARIWDRTPGTAPPIQMANQLGLQGLAIPEEYGGSGFSYVELIVVLEEMGRALLCAPYFSTVALAANTLLHSGRLSARLLTRRVVRTIRPGCPTGRPAGSGSRRCRSRGRSGNVRPICAASRSSPEAR